MVCVYHGRPFHTIWLTSLCRSSLPLSPSDDVVVRLAGTRQRTMAKGMIVGDRPIGRDRSPSPFSRLR